MDDGQDERLLADDIDEADSGKTEFRRTRYTHRRRGRGEARIRGAALGAGMLKRLIADD